MQLVVGATGFLGREICRRLAGRGQRVCGLTRPGSDPEALALLRQWGVQTVHGDLADAASLEAACRGADVVVSTASATRPRQPGDSIERADHQGQLALVEAAERAGVRRFVYVSFSGGIGGEDPLTRAKRDVERRLRESAMSCSILRPTFFMEAWLGPALGFDHANAVATIYGSGENRTSWISRADVAEFAVRCAEDTGAGDVTLELGGPEALSALEVVRIFEQESGRPFEIRRVPEEALRAQLAAATDSLGRTFATLMLACAKGDPIPMEETLARYPLRLRTVRDYAREVLRPGAGRA